MPAEWFQTTVGVWTHAKHTKLKIVLFWFPFCFIIVVIITKAGESLQIKKPNKFLRFHLLCMCVWCIVFSPPFARTRPSMCSRCNVLKFKWIDFRFQMCVFYLQLVYKTIQINQHAFSYIALLVVFYRTEFVNKKCEFHANDFGFNLFSIGNSLPVSNICMFVDWMP